MEEGSDFGLRNRLNVCLAKTVAEMTIFSYSRVPITPRIIDF